VSVILKIFVVAVLNAFHCATFSSIVSAETPDLAIKPLALVRTPRA
jgi:hypothetical protein